MNKVEMTEAIILAKKKKGVSWEQISEKVGLSPVFLTSACLGQNRLDEATASKLCDFLELDKEVADVMTDFVSKSWEKSIPQDPVVYRFYEIIGVYGDSIKAIIHEKFGDGIMSAIDFNMDIKKQEDPKGDRVVVTMNGKFLPYKYF